VIYSQAALEANGALWLKYTPFNQVGRSPLPDLAESEMIAWPSLILYVITCTISAEPDRTTRNPCSYCTGLPDVICERSLSLL
jgi:hypothetical protein